MLKIELEEGLQVLLSVDESKRKLNSRNKQLKVSRNHCLESHLSTKCAYWIYVTLSWTLLDVCLEKVGLNHLEPGKGYHFPDVPCVEYKSTVPQAELQTSELCGGGLPDYIPKESTPCVVKLGDLPGCPCSGTHVSDISDLVNIKATQVRTKKGITKVYYQIGSKINSALYDALWAEDFYIDIKELFSIRFWLSQL
ncbi:hypothetical protein CTI12_AA036710 [Artemisia annua]|uniref:Threonyl/alanyl tRNA synthetase SAD domain-containing protein n=1 Tax=Artemisia annua TaxID=35608 RepID=A0A2U1QFM5_ARTAN|nr:hypothetical protein CTI12_AA036710 [Artemisia annua]